MAREATPGVLIPLGIGAILSPVAIPLLLVASVLATRIRFRRPVVARAFNLLIGLTMTLGLVTSFGERGSFDLFAWYDASAGWAQLACLALFVAVPLIVGEGLRRGERPTSPWDGDDPGRR